MTNKNRKAVIIIMIMTIVFVTGCGRGILVSRSYSGGSFGKETVTSEKKADVNTKRTNVEPDSAYDKYQEVHYKGVTGVVYEALVSTDKNENKFCLQFPFFDDNVVIHAEKTEDGKYHITDGDFMQTDGQGIVEQAVSTGEWNTIR